LSLPVLAAQISNCLLKAIKTSKHSLTHTHTHRTAHTHTPTSSALSQKCLLPISESEKKAGSKLQTAQSSNGERKNALRAERLFHKMN